MEGNEQFFNRLKEFKLSKKTDFTEREELKTWFHSNITRLYDLSEEDKVADLKYKNQLDEDNLDADVLDIQPIIREGYSVKGELVFELAYLSGLIARFKQQENPTDTQKSCVRYEFIRFLEKEFKQEGGRNKRSKHRKMRKTRKSLIRRRR